VNQYCSETPSKSFFNNIDPKRTLDTVQLDFSGANSSRKPCTEAALEGPARRLRPDEITTPSHLNRVTRARAPVAHGTFSEMRAAGTGGCVTQRRDRAIPQEWDQCSNFRHALRRLRAICLRSRARISRSKQEGQDQCAS
jgi:hypothetical protein